MQVRKNSLGFNKAMIKKEVFLFKEDILIYDLPKNKQIKIRILEA